MKRVLLQMAGTGRNARTATKRPGLILARAVGVAEAIVIVDPTDPAAEEVGKALVDDLGKVVRTARLYRAKAAPDRKAAHSPRIAGDQLEPVVRKLVDTYGHEETTQMLVSLESGTPAQQLTLARLLHEGGGAEGRARWRYNVSLLTLDDGRAIELALPPPRSLEPGMVDPSDREAMLAHLEHLPAGRPLLLTGPTGVGKTETARALHRRWHDEKAPFEHVNCAAIAPNLVESELFGHEKGAFTGADQRKEGAFELADGGTLFLDEVGELPLDVQAKLLLALEPVDGTYEVRSVGGRLHRTKARVILATNRDLRARVREGQFRDDLLARISAHVLRLPPLRERRHAVLEAYLARLSNEPSLGGAHFQLELPAWKRLVRFAFEPEHAWTWNYRDVVQSAERIAMRAWAHRGYRKTSGWIRVEERFVEAELRELAESWKAWRIGAPTAALEPPEVPMEEAAREWEPLRRALEPGAFEEMTQLERWEARYLFEALSAADGSKAAAWRWLCDRRVLTRATGGVNPSDAFKKRWRKFRWAAKAIR